MRSLGRFSDADGLSQLLLRLTVNSTLYCLSEMTAPWGFQVAARSGPAFHLLTAGSAWLEVQGQVDPVRLAAGDHHALRSNPRKPPRKISDFLTLSQFRRLDLHRESLASCPSITRWRSRFRLHPSW